MTSSTLLYSAAALMALSGIPMAVSASPALGAGGRCLHGRCAEKQLQKGEAHD